VNENPLERERAAEISASDSGYLHAGRLRAGDQKNRPRAILKKQSKDKKNRLIGRISRAY
jgi:hypothetical protein